MMSLTGKILMTCDLARRYGIKDMDGKVLLVRLLLLLAAIYRDIIIFLPQDGMYPITHRLNSS